MSSSSQRFYNHDEISQAKKRVRALLLRRSTALDGIPFCERDDPCFMLAAFEESQNGALLRFASRRLRGDAAVVEAAVRLTPQAAQHALVKGKQDRHRLKELMREWHGAYTTLKTRPIDWSDDPHLVLAAVKEDVRALQFACPTLLQHDRAINSQVRESMHQQLGLDQIPDVLLRDSSIIAQARRFNGLAYAWQLAMQRLCKGPAALAAVRENGMLFFLLPDHVKTDKFIEVVLVQIALELLPMVAMAAVKQNGLFFRHVPVACRTIELAEAAVKQDGRALKFVPDTLLTMGIPMNTVMQNGEALQMANEVLIQHAVSNYGLALQHAPVGFCSNQDIVLLAVKQNGMALQYAAPTLQDNEQVVVQAVEQNYGACLYASRRMRETPELAALAMIHENSLRHLSDAQFEQICVVLSALRRREAGNRTYNFRCMFGQRATVRQYAENWKRHIYEFMWMVDSHLEEQNLLRAICAYADIRRDLFAANEMIRLAPILVAVARVGVPRWVPTTSRWHHTSANQIRYSKYRRLSDLLLS